MADVDWRQIPPLASLRAFEAASRLGGFSAAARTLNVTPAAIIQQVRALEAHLDVSLVQRDGKSIVLTAAGTQLATHLQNGFGAIADGIAELRETEAARGLRVATTNFIVDALILPEIGAYWARHPGAEVAFMPGQCCQTVTPAFFNEHRADIVVMTGDKDWPGVISEPLLSCPVHVVGTPDLCRRAAKDLHAVPWIWTEEDRHMAGVMAQIGVCLERLTLVDLGSQRLEMSAVRAGAGLTLCAEVVARADLEAGTLEKMDIPIEIVTHYRIATLPGPRRRAVCNFIDWIHELAQSYQAKSPIQHNRDDVVLWQ
ncbi:MAG: LysR substrate-binding domain-containing protein [Pseudomonadota bacterium]